MFKLDLEKEEPEIKLPTSAGSWKNKRVPEKQLFLFYDYAKAFDCVEYHKLWEIWRRLEYQTTWPASWEICMQVKKEHLGLAMEQQTGSK